MTTNLRLGDGAPDFEVETTEGRIRFHEWLGDSWGVLFSHPKDFTPVCTTELGYTAKLKPEFEKRGVKVIGLSVDPLEKHADWSQDIEDVTGYAPNFPMIADADRNVSGLYGMLDQTAADSQIRRDPARDRLAAAHGQAQGRYSRQLEARRGRHRRGGGVRRRGQGDVRQFRRQEAVPAARS